MKTFKIESRDVIDPLVKKLIDKFDGIQAHNHSIYALDSEIEFIVNDCSIAHGNLSKGSKSAWLAPKNGDNSWNVSIKW